MPKVELWEKIIKQTNYFDLPVLFKNLLTKKLCSEDTIKKVFENISNNKDIEPNIRVFIEGGRQKFEYDRLVIDNPPYPDEALESWSKRLFQEQSFGIILNKTERWNDELLKNVLEFILPLHNEFTIPEYSFELTLFIGNYLYTPLGVHVDGDYERSILFNLYGNKRIIYTWNPEKFRELTGSYQQYFYPERIVNSTSKNYELENNDIFILPSKLYHLLSNHGFTVGMSIAIQKSTKKKIIEESKKLYFKHFSDNIVNDINIDIFKPNPSERIDISEINDTVKDIDFKYALNDFCLLRKSNLGFLESPFENITPVQFAEISIVQIIFPFKILCSKVDETLHIYCRGRKITVSYHREIEFMIELLNKGNKYSLKELYSLNKGLSKEILIHLLKLFYKLRVLEVI